MNTLTTAKEHILGQSPKELLRKFAIHKPVQAGQHGVI